jgi:hypothetical protein
VTAAVGFQEQGPVGLKLLWWQVLVLLLCSGCAGQVTCLAVPSHCKVKMKIKAGKLNPR